MVEIGDSIADFAVPVVADDIERCRLTDLTAGEPIALAFFPAAFTGTCTTEMETFRDCLGTDMVDRLYGVSVDSPFVLSTFREQHSLPFGLISDFNRELTDALGLSISFDDLGLDGLSQRAVVWLDADLTVTYGWVADNPGQEPPYERVIDARPDA